MRPIKVLIVDDSALIRSMLTKILEADPGIRVVDTAADAYEAREKIKATNPDVLTLDIEMPKMDGIAFLRNIMRLRPMPVVMISTLTQKGAPLTLQALELGAVGFLGKPMSDSGTAASLKDYSDDIINLVKAAAVARVRSTEPAPKASAPSPASSLAAGRYRSGSVLAIGASTGGTEAIKDVVTLLPRTCPPVVITQHIPAAFSASYADRLNRSSSIHVKEAQDGDILMPGHAYLAPGSHHLVFVKSSNGRHIECRLSEEERVNRHRPSVEVMFDSLAKVVAPKYISAVILTGMGADGAAALKRLRDSGAHTIAQNEATSVVWGMPGAAVKLDAACEVLPLGTIAKHLLKAVSQD